jgi:flagellar hook assembly protein FlgD
VWVGAPDRLREKRAATRPEALSLAPPAPNPTASSTRLRYTIPARAAPAHAELTVYDVLGRRVQRLVDARKDAGRYVARWDGRDARGRPLASGVYLCRLLVDGTPVATRKVTLVR